MTFRVCNLGSKQSHLYSAYVFSKRCISIAHHCSSISNMCRIFHGHSTLLLNQDFVPSRMICLKMTGNINMTDYLKSSNFENAY